MYDVDYVKWADYIENIFKFNGLKPSLILDLGCGTGSFCMEMSQRGYDMIGLDISSDMLSCAKEKALDKGLDILFLNQDMTAFELYGTVDAIVCLIDSLNYITDKRDVKKVFSLVRNYLNPGGLLIFDINTVHKLENVLGGNVFYDVSDDTAYIWENGYDKKRKLCRFDLTFFIKDGDFYKRHDEIHYERAYSISELEELIADSGLSLINTYGDLSLKKPGLKCERIFFVCKKQ